MLDRFMLPIIKQPLNQVSRLLDKTGVTANQVTIAGFVVGMMAIPLIATQNYALALAAVIFNRISDGLDGSLAQIQGPTDQGAFLDISLDFVFYSAVILGFGLVSPEQNALAAAALIYAFICTGVSFLAFSIMAERRQLDRLIYPNKGIHYMAGIAEGTETILFFLFILIWPDYFVPAAWIFALICYVSAGLRIWSGYHILDDSSEKSGTDSDHLRDGS